MNRRDRRALVSKARAEGFPAEARAGATPLVAQIVEGVVDESLIDEENMQKLNEKLGNTADHVLRRYLASEDFAAMIERKIAAAAEPIIVEALAERIPSIEARVHALVVAEFEGAVVEEAKRRIAAAIEEVRERFAGSRKGI